MYCTCVFDVPYWIDWTQIFFSYIMNQANNSGHLGLQSIVLCFVFEIVAKYLLREKWNETESRLK